MIYPEVYALRKEYGKTQKELAEVIGISTNQYGRKERGEMAWHDYEMKILIDYYNVLPEIIFPTIFGFENL